MKMPLPVYSTVVWLKVKAPWTLRTSKLGEHGLRENDGASDNKYDGGSFHD